MPDVTDEDLAAELCRTLREDACPHRHHGKAFRCERCVRAAGLALVAAVRKIDALRHVATIRELMEGERDRRAPQLVQPNPGRPAG